MIKLLNSSGMQIPFELTVFPDKTSQAWKISETLHGDINAYNILWQFENEGELIQVCQLAQLCKTHFGVKPRLICPYLPYARQDKNVSNDSTFAKHTFLTLLKGAGFTSVTAYDAHSHENDVIPVISMKPLAFFESVYDHDYVCFPDNGAFERYNLLFKKPYFVAEKVRNQQTGKIEGMKLLDITPDKLSGKKILMFDDLCDGGGTFVGLMNLLKECNPAQVDLAVSHGVFSNSATSKLWDCGVNEIYTTNTLGKESTGRYISAIKSERESKYTTNFYAIEQLLDT